MNLVLLDKKVKKYTEDINSLKGMLILSENTYDKLRTELNDLKELQILNTKAIELLNHVQKITRDLIQTTFETIVTRALQYIYQNNDYKFELEFDRRGNIPKLRFLLKTPDMQNAHDIMTTRAGGAKDIVALALRFVLLEVARIPGFVFLDEPEKRLDEPETFEKLIEFIQETQKNTKRQMFIITHKNEIINAVSNPIILTKKQSTPIPKKRGRPKKER